MYTLREAKALQRERETKSILLFIWLAVTTGVISFLLLKYTDWLETSTIFYLIPFAGIAFSVKKSGIHHFFEEKEFYGKITNMDVYMVKSQRVKGERSYIQYENLEVEIIAENEKKTRVKVLRSCDATKYLSVGTDICILRFVEEPIIIE